jgi:hypothetical protein
MLDAGCSMLDAGLPLFRKALLACGDAGCWILDAGLPLYRQEPPALRGCSIWGGVMLSR